MDNQQPSIKQLIYTKPKNGMGFIYKYTSPIGKSYIGQTVNSLFDRARTCGIGYKKCSVFWRAIQKYGWNNFQVEIIEEVPIEFLNEKEKYYINLFNTISPQGYNLSTGGDAGKKREVYVYNVQNRKFLEHYSSLSEAASETGVPIETISAILNEKSTRRKTCHNLTFLSYYVDRLEEDMTLRKNYHKVYVYDKNGEFITSFDKITDAAKALKISDSSIRQCIQGIRTHVGEYQFLDYQIEKMDSIPKNSKTPVSVCQINPDTGEIIAIYPSYASAGRAVGLSSGDGIRKVIARGKGLSGGYFWKLNEGSTTK